MSDPKRYSEQVNEENDWNVVEHPQGEFVLWQDYSRLKAALKEAEDSLFDAEEKLALERHKLAKSEEHNDALCERIQDLGSEIHAASCANGLAHKRINDLERQLAGGMVFPDWLPIDSAPLDGTWVMCHCENQGHIVLRFNRNDGWNNFDTYELRPTHWMPLPNPPEL